MTSNRGTNPKRTLTPRELFDQDPMQWWTSHAKDVGELMRGESPRGAAVLARAYLETVLDEFLLRLAMNNQDSRNDIVRAVAGGLKRKIEVCRDFRIFDPHTLKYANLIRQIGDRYAHHPELGDFDHDDVLLNHFEEFRHMIGPPPELTSASANRMLGMGLRHVIVILAAWRRDKKEQTNPTPTQ